MTDAAKQLRKTVLKMAYAGADGNLQSNFSSIEILRAVFDRTMRITPDMMANSGRDRFVLSKGQSTMGLLAILSEKGFIPKDELWSACKYNSRISMQADRTKLPCVEISAGSLGHGFPMAVGMAWANKIAHREGIIYVLAGDGEMNEGTMWEAAIFAGSEKLDNLALIIDDNASIGEMVNMGNLSAKMRAFGFFTAETDGHDEGALASALKTEHKDCPLAVVAKTKRGYGSRIMMEDSSWFHRAPTHEELEKLLQDVEDYE